jgi:pimeloyl-ACP methyl ester carboxylesterase
MAVAEPIVVNREGSQLFGDRWAGGSPVVVLLHAGVADRRCWSPVAAGLAGPATVVAYDRRGFGQTAPSTTAFSHVDDLEAVLDEVGADRAWLVGNSMGGGLALDFVLTVPERVEGLVLLAPAVSGAPEPAWDAAIQPFEDGITRAWAAKDLDEVNRLETWLWLDGPAGPEGRVGGPARTLALALAMNRVILENDDPEEAGGSNVDAWSRLGEVDVPGMVACGDRDISFLVTRSSEVARCLPRGHHRVLDGMAHLPSLEQPATVVALVTEALTTK